MSVGLMESPIVARAKRETETIRLDADIVEKVRIIAQTRGVTAMEYLSGLVRDQVEADYAVAHKALPKPRRPRPE